MLDDAWYSFRSDLIAFAQLHSRELIVAGLLAVVAWFVWRWLSAR